MSADGKVRHGVILADDSAAKAGTPLSAVVTSSAAGAAYVVFIIEIPL